MKGHRRVQIRICDNSTTSKVKVYLITHTKKIALEFEPQERGKLSKNGLHEVKGIVKATEEKSGLHYI